MRTPPFQHIRYTQQANGVVHLTLNRPKQANAFNAEMIAELVDAMDNLAQQSNVRALMVSGEGKHFCAGADIHWMQTMVDKDQTENHADAYQLATLMNRLDTLPFPTLALVHGSAFGGALGLLCCCDVVFASNDARFCLSEVKLGLVAATIAPYVIRAIGVRQARRYMLSAELFDVQTALSLGLIHHCSDLESASIAATRWLSDVARHGPQALRETKTLCHHCYQHTIDQSLIQHTSDLIARVRVSNQGQEGLRAFLQKRPPIWPTE